MNKKVFSLILGMGIIFSSCVPASSSFKSSSPNKTKNVVSSYLSNHKRLVYGGGGSAAGLALMVASASGLKTYGNSKLFPFAFEKGLESNELDGPTTPQVVYGSSPTILNPHVDHIQIGDLHGYKYKLKEKEGDPIDGPLKDKYIIVYGCNDCSFRELLEKRCPNATGKLLKAGATIVACDYRGYGYSHMALAGLRMSESTIYKDGEAVYNYVNKTLGVKSENIIAFGYSLGGSVASHVAAYASNGDNGLGGLMLVSPINSFYKVGSKMFCKPLAWTAKTLMRSSLDTLDNLGKISNKKSIKIYASSGTKDRGDGYKYDYLSIEDSGVKDKIESLEFNNKPVIALYNEVIHLAVRQMFGEEFDNYINSFKN